MNKKTTYPKVAIVGRTNVGKSTLFNRLTKSKQSIVFPREGVTRDYLHSIVSWKDKVFDLIDTGGLFLTKTTDEILKEVKTNVLSLIKNVDLILFMCDAKSGLTELDRTLAKLLFKEKKPILLLLNKIDNTRAFEEQAYEFDALGIKNIFPISAVHGTGVPELLNEITERIESVELEPEEVEYKIAILGKPNVGKSSLLNLLLKEDRAIVSDVAGTTRESISETVTIDKDNVQITDTAGVRRKSRVRDPLEEEMVKSSLRSVRNSDIAIIMIDGNEGHLADQELKLLFYAYEEKKSIILAINKTDTLSEEMKNRLLYDLKRYDFLIKKISVVWISCETKKNTGKILQEVEKARKRREQKFEQEEINEFIKNALIKKPLYHKRQLLKILNVKPLYTEKVPMLILYVNFPAWFGPTQLGYIENRLRKKYDLLGCPIVLIPRKV